MITTSKIFLYTLYIMRNVSLERYYFILYDGALTLKKSNMALIPFFDKTLHIYKLLFDFLEGIANTKHPLSTIAK